MSLLLALALAARPSAFAVEERGELLDFNYRWPAAAEAIAPLRRQLAARMARARSDATRYARTDRADSAANGRPFETHLYAGDWHVAGSTPVLLSLAAEISSFTGGVHGNRDYSAILWDLAANRRSDIAALLGRDTLAALQPRFCAALDAMRSERRNEALPSFAGDPFTACPALARQAMAPADQDGNGRFEMLRAMLPPYAAGPYAEGEYWVDLPFEPADFDALPDGYRPAFEVPGDRITAPPDE